MCDCECDSATQLGPWPPNVDTSQRGVEHLRDTVEAQSNCNMTVLQAETRERRRPSINRPRSMFQPFGADSKSCGVSVIPKPAGELLTAPRRNCHFGDP